MARPLKEAGQQRNVAVNIRITEQEKKMLETLAAARGIDKTTLVVSLVREDMERRKDLIDMYYKMQELRK